MFDLNFLFIGPLSYAMRKPVIFCCWPKHIQAPPGGYPPWSPPRKTHQRSSQGQGVAPSLCDPLRRAAGYLAVMPLFRSRLPIISIEPCVPSFAKVPPTGPDWIHEIKHDGFRIIARRDSKKVRLISRKGKDLTYRFPSSCRRS